MNCLEVINLRTGCSSNDGLDKILVRLVVEFKKEYKNVRVTLFRHATVTSDWSFHLHYQSEIRTKSPDLFGAMLVRTLQEFGMVHHSLWLEETE